MTAEGLNMIYLGIALIAVAIVARRLKKLDIARRFHGLLPGALKKEPPADRMFEKLRVPANKKCPSCAHELPLSALLCDGCDFNFLAGSVIRSARMLPAPEPMNEAESKRHVASAMA